ncbi:hypothetical protein KR093_009537, partial [Drosophila rubida]
ILNSAIAEYSDNVQRVDRNPELYLANPASSLKLMRHMSQDWAAWQELMEAPLAADKVQMQQRLLAKTPRPKDIQLAVERLQSVVKFYNYQPAFFLQQSPHLRLSPLDYYQMGVDLYELQDYQAAAAWLTVATENYTTTPLNDLIGIPLWRVYEMQFEALFKIDMQHSAYVALSTALQLAPQNAQLLQQRQRLGPLSPSHRLMDLIQEPVVVVSKLQQQCAAQPRQDTKLSCEYDRGTAFLMMAPLAVEDVWFDPYLMVYKNGIYEREILHIKQAFAGCPETHKFEESLGISGCLIPSSYSFTIRRISERLQLMARSDGPMEGFFVLQYGSTDAFQFFQLDTVSFLRDALDGFISECMFFLAQLNDVALGGALTIPSTELVLQPSRGDALISFNEDNFEHTMCPNVVGTSM